MIRLFVLNKKDFDFHFQDETKEIHRRAYNELVDIVNSEGKIPLSITVDDCYFEFKSVKEVQLPSSKVASGL